MANLNRLKVVLAEQQKTGKYGRGYVHMTSRQGIEIPFIKVEELAEVKEALA